MPQKRMLLTGGLSLTLRNWPAFVWTYGFNVALALLFSLPLHQQIGDITAHSLAAQRLTGAFDLGTVAEITLKLSKGPGPATHGSYLSIPFYLLLYFLIVPGTLSCYQTGEPARLFSILQSGLSHFWRFVRLTLITLVISLPILAGLSALHGLWSDHIDETMVGRPAFLLDLAGLVLVGLVAAVLRVYFDLMQVYTVQLGTIDFPVTPGKKGRPERQVRRTFKPAWHAFRHNFFRLYLSFVLLTVLGLGAAVLTTRAAAHSLAQPRAWPMFLLAQLGLFLMLFTRFWQRGAETVLANDLPIPEPVIVVPAPVISQLPSAEPVPLPAEDHGGTADQGIGLTEPLEPASNSPQEPSAFDI